MSADVVNLTRARKRKVRADEATKAAGNRAIFGRTRLEREATKLTRDRLENGLDGHRLRASDDEAN